MLGDHTFYWTLENPCKSELLETSFHFFVCLWNYFVCGLSLLSLITVPSPGLYRFFSKCEILPWNPSSHDSPWVWPGGLCNFCGLLQCKQEKESEPRFLQCAACVQETDRLSSISGTFIALCSLASKAWAISSAGGQLWAIGVRWASGGPSSHWRSAGTGLEESAGAAWEIGDGFFLFQRGNVNKCDAPASPSHHPDLLQVTSSTCSFVFDGSPKSIANGTASCTLVKIICESVVTQRTCFPHPPATFSTQISCNFLLWSCTFWGWCFPSVDRDRALAHQVEIFSFFIKALTLTWDESPSCLQLCFYSHWYYTNQSYSSLVSSSCQVKHAIFNKVFLPHFSCCPNPARNSFFFWINLSFHWHVFFSVNFTQRGNGLILAIFWRRGICPVIWPTMQMCNDGTSGGTHGDAVLIFWDSPFWLSRLHPLAPSCWTGSLLPNKSLSPSLDVGFSAFY